MTILDDADDVTRNARQSAYGHPLDNHGCTAQLWTSYIERRYGAKINVTALDVCYMMILVKISRLANDPTHLDSLVDIAGYARNAEMIMHELDLINDIGK